MKIKYAVLAIVFAALASFAGGTVFRAHKSEFEQGALIEEAHQARKSAYEQEALIEQRDAQLVEKANEILSLQADVARA
jgi:hypothetical protein